MRCNKIYYICIIIFSLIGCNTDDTEDNKLTISNISTEKSEIDSSLEKKRTPDSVIANAFKMNQSTIQVLVRGKVIKLLSDDTVGDKHQRMILKIENGMTLLIAHNIDIAERIPNAVLNKTIYAYGVYEWNAEGGVLHWTHKDPNGTHENGWVKFDTKIYQ